MKLTEIFSNAFNACIHYKEKRRRNYGGKLGFIGKKDSLPGRQGHLGKENAKVLSIKTFAFFLAFFLPWR
jgi:hypothetical protein